MKLFLALVLILLCVAGLFAGFAYWAWEDLNAPNTSEKTRIYLDIPRGVTPDETVARLHRAGVVKNELPLRLYIRWKNLGPQIKAGTYCFVTPVTPLEVLSELKQGGQGINRLTVIEGWTRWDIAQALVQIPTLKLRNADEALALIDDVRQIADLDPEAKSLEGYLFPDTYFIVPDATAAEMVSQMVKRFRQIYADNIKRHLAKEHKSVHELVTMASIIETEAKLKGERPMIASVIVNRLKSGMPLAMDSTVVYASKLAGKWRNDGKVYQSDLDLDSPYNTRKYKGLPPGPVGNPGLASLLAAMRPAQTDYLYYVRNPARDDGAHSFYQDDTGFARGVKALRDWERERDARARSGH